MTLVESAVFITCLLAGPLIVARVCPKRTGVTGTPLAGQSGMSPIFWGAPAGMITATAILVPFIPPTVFSSELDRLQQAILLFGILVALSAPLLIWGANLWTWDMEGLDFRGVFRHRKIAWSEVTKVEPAREGGCAISTAQGVVLRTSKWVSGNHLIVAALHHYRSAAFIVPAGAAHER